MNVLEEKATFFRSHYDSILMLPTVEEQNTMFKAVFDYIFYGMMPTLTDKPYLDAIFTSWKPVLDKSIELRRTASENGKKGGAPLGNKNACKEKTTDRLNENKLKEKKNKNKDMKNECEEGYENPLVSGRDEEESGKPSIDFEKVYASGRNQCS